MKNLFLILSILFIFGFDLSRPKVTLDNADTSLKSDSIAKLFAKTIMVTYPDSIVVKKFVQHMLQDKQGTDPDKRPASWNYEEAVVLGGFIDLWKYKSDKTYFNYMQRIVDHFINDDGSIRTYLPQEYNSDQVTGGRLLLTLYKETKQEKYRKAADLLRKQIEWQPRTKEGGFWHKHKYPYQMWLDCMFMFNVFYAEYCQHNNTPQYFDDVANQLIWTEKHTRDTKTGLLYHGWDESKSQKWANPETGQSPEVWSRAMGWYCMSLVEILEVFPKNHPKRKDLINILQRLAPILEKYQDAASGVWYQIVDKGTWKGNYLEASGSTHFSYALAKAARLGFIDKKYIAVAQKGFDGILKNFVDMDAKGLIHIHHSCSGGGLGGEPYRSGTFEYYINEPKRSDDLKTIGPLIKLAIEMDRIGYHSKIAIAGK